MNTLGRNVILLIALVLFELIIIYLVITLFERFLHFPEIVDKEFIRIKTRKDSMLGCVVTKRDLSKKVGPSNILLDNVLNYINWFLKEYISHKKLKKRMEKFISQQYEIPQEMQ